MKKLALFFMIIGGLFAQQITGVFGLKLGDKLTNYKNVKILKKETEDDGTLTYTVIPPKKISYIDEYYIHTSPIKKTIYAIIGIKEYNNFNNCTSRLEYLEKLLENKYDKFKTITDNDIKKMILLKQNNSLIALTCEDKITKSYFGIVYENMKLREKAIQEAVEAHKNELNDF
jgi:hypothetical protein